jgi:alkylhydroperoxidase/carboxymuconolactone decarboxylase family protein YurZ
VIKVSGFSWNVKARDWIEMFLLGTIVLMEKTLKQKTRNLIEISLCLSKMVKAH